MQKGTRALQFTTKLKEKIYMRDNGCCIFCMMKYNLPEQERMEQGIYDIMHFVPKSSGGLGIEENGVLGCRYHHQMLDQGHNGSREEMLNIMKEYLISEYAGWNKEKLYYTKY